MEMDCSDTDGKQTANASVAQFAFLQSLVAPFFIASTSKSFSTRRAKICARCWPITGCDSLSFQPGTNERYRSRRHARAGEPITNYDSNPQAEVNEHTQILLDESYIYGNSVKDHHGVPVKFA
jgi:hypothetical protein